MLDQAQVMEGGEDEPVVDPHPLVSAGGDLGAEDVAEVPRIAGVVNHRDKPSPVDVPRLVGQQDRLALDREQQCAGPELMVAAALDGLGPGPARVVAGEVANAAANLGAGVGDERIEAFASHPLANPGLATLELVGLKWHQRPTLSPASQRNRGEER